MALIEIWRNIEGYAGIYQVSNLGRVKSFHRDFNGRILVPRLTHNGYEFVSLCKDGLALGKRVHRLVAEAFIPNDYDLPQINHIDGNKLNNSVDNLEWCSASQNTNHALTNKLRVSPKGEKHWMHKLTDGEVADIKREYIPYDEHYGGKSLSIKYGVSPYYIRQLANGRCRN